MSLPERTLHVVSGTDASPPKLHVAFATADRSHIDQHFGSTRNFLIYAIDERQAVVTDAVEFKPVVAGHDAGKIALKVAALMGCAAVYCNAIGPSAIRQLLHEGIHPIKVGEGTPIISEIHLLQQQLAQGPQGWLAKAISQPSAIEPDPNRLQAMLDDDW